MLKFEELIKCPKCKSIQKATIEQSIPWWVYVHFCKCGNIITESDWVEITNDELGRHIDLLV